MYIFAVAGNLSISGSCNGTYEIEENEITTPNFPSFYPNNKQCKWTIEVTHGKYIELKFEEFRLEISYSCSYDWLQIYDGGSINSSALAEKLCGTVKPSNIKSTGNKLFIEWESNYAQAYSGFKISASVKGMF